MTADPMDRYIAEAAWLLAHPHFEQKPATISEFLGPGYLDIEAKVRPGVKEALEGIFGEEVSGDRIALYEEAMVTGAIGIGKTTFASIALPYMAHWVLCLKDPQDYFNLLPGSRIAFMQMSTSEDQALQVIYSDIKARIEHAEWFVENYPHDPKYTKQIRFPKDVWILPGDSSETTFEGYNILAGILDEMDSHKVTRDKDYAEQGFDTIHSRIASRFTDDAGEGHKGLIICIGQMKKGTGFAAKKYKEMLANPKSHVTRIEGCSARWRLKHNADSPVKLTTPTRVEFEDWFEAKNDPRKRVIHIDMATSGDGDSLGMAMGHVPEMVEIDGELKPYIMIDCLIRLRAAAGQEIILSDVRNLIYRMKFDLGFRIVKTTIDGFQSTDTMQQLRKKRISAEHLSVDRTTLPYEDLREAIYEERIDFPKYMVYLKPGDLKSVDIAYQELSRLTDTGKKIDHPQDGSKDVADAIAGVCYTLMGDRTYRKGVSSGERGQSVNGADWLRKQGVNIDELLRESPIPPSVGGLKAPPISGGGVGVFIPPRLSPRGRD
jgi:hypothetical protein